MILVAARIGKDAVIFQNTIFDVASPNTLSGRSLSEKGTMMGADVVLIGDAAVVGASYIVTSTMPRSGSRRRLHKNLAKASRV